MIYKGLVTPEDIRLLGIGSEWTWADSIYYSDERQYPSTKYVITGFNGDNVRFKEKGDEEDEEYSGVTYTLKDFGRYLRPRSLELEALAPLKNLLAQIKSQGLESEIQELLVKLEV